MAGSGGAVYAVLDNRPGLTFHAPREKDTTIHSSEASQLGMTPTLSVQRRCERANFFLREFPYFAMRVLIGLTVMFSPPGNQDFVRSASSRQAVLCGCVAVAGGQSKKEPQHRTHPRIKIS